MTDRTCEKCGRTFKFPCHLQRHQTRTTPCEPILEQDESSKKGEVCRFCGRSFTSYTNLRRHIRERCRIAPREGNEKGMELLYDHVLKKQELALSEMRRLSEKMEGRLAAFGVGGSPSATIAPTGGNNMINVDQRTNNITISIFGRENTDHLTYGVVKQIMDEAVAGPGSTVEDPTAAATRAVLKAASLIYSDPARPENITCFLPAERKDTALVHGERGWQLMPVKLTLPPMASTSIEALFRRQPLPGLEGCDGMRDHHDYEAVYKELQANEQRYLDGKDLHAVLVTNKELLRQLLGKIPRVASVPPALPDAPKSEPEPVDGTEP